MKALVKFAPGPGNVDILDVDEPSCGTSQVKVEVAFCGLCGTDIHVLQDTFRNYPPVILGHEFSGTVVEVGSEVAGVKCGEKVACLGATAITCGECRYCISGNFIFCSNRRGMGHGVNGGFATIRSDETRSTLSCSCEHPAGRSRSQRAIRCGRASCHGIDRGSYWRHGTRIGSRTNGTSLCQIARGGRYPDDRRWRVRRR